MFTITFKKDNATVTEAFEKYYELIRFVAVNRIKDEDFVSLNLGEAEINGLDGLCETAMGVADKMEEAEAELEAMMNELNGEAEDEEDE